jgi:hypothetical protein
MDIVRCETDFGILYVQVDEGDNNAFLLTEEVE